MGAISGADIRNVVVLGHKGAGKTSLLAAMRQVANGKPDEGRAPDPDETPEEREHGGTMEARVVRLGWRGTVLNLLDTPGEPSFFADTQLALTAADAAILAVSSTEGIQTWTERLFACVREAKLPCLVVITKIDDDDVREGELAKEIRERLHAPIAVMEVMVRPPNSAHVNGVIPLEKMEALNGLPTELGEKAQHARVALIEEVAATDDALTDHYLTDETLSQSELDDGLRRAVASAKLVPLFAESATEHKGIAPLLDALTELVPRATEHPTWPGQPHDRPALAELPVAAFVFKTRIDRHAGRLSYARILSGVVRNDTVLVNAETGAEERIAHLLQPNGKGLTTITEASAGDIIAISKLKTTHTGDTLSDEKSPFVLAHPPLQPPFYARALLVEGRGAMAKVTTTLQRLAEEDPGLHHRYDESTREMVLSGTGPLHLEIAVERLRRRSGIACELGPPKVAYRETLTRRAARIEGKQKKQTGGHGQFGVCVIDLEPLERGAGFVFEDAVVGGSVPRQFISSVEKGVLRAMARGVLAGYPVVDIKVRLVDGKAHSVDSSDAAFQVAGFKAFMAAAKSAHPAILEPVAKVQVTLPEEAMGEVLGDLNSRHAKVLAADGDDDGARRMITAYLPLASMKDYEPSLTRMTHGRGTFTMSIDHYDFAPPHVQERLVRESGFKPVEEG
ncbi:MAG: elongation factor G [Polyangiaceae bacterium]